MDYKEAKESFLNTWGTLGSTWGINKTMAQIQALLFISADPLSVEEIMEELTISRGNVSMNLRQLMDWRIVHKELVPGERKEYFTTIKDVEKLSTIIAEERSRREIQPAIRILVEVSSIKIDENNKDEVEFVKQTKALYGLADTANNMLQQLLSKKEHWLTKSLLKILR